MKVAKAATQLHQDMSVAEALDAMRALNAVLAPGAVMTETQDIVIPVLAPNCGRCYSSRWESWVGCWSISMAAAGWWVHRRVRPVMPGACPAKGLRRGVGGAPACAGASLSRTGE